MKNTPFVRQDKGIGPAEAAVPALLVILVSVCTVSLDSFLYTLSVHIWYLNHLSFSCF